MKKSDIVQLAKAYLESPFISAPQWDEEKRQWVTLTPHGTGTSSCGAPDFTGTPATDADIKPHQKLLWRRCQRCQLIRPWGGCDRRQKPGTYSYIPGGRK